MKIIHVSSCFILVFVFIMSCVMGSQLENFVRGLDVEKVKVLLNNQTVDYFSLQYAFKFFYDEAKTEKEIKSIKEILKLMIPKAPKKLLENIYNFGDGKYKQPLWYAVYKKDKDIIESLLNHKDINFDNDSWFLQFLFFYNLKKEEEIKESKEILKLLISKASDSNLISTNDQNKTALWVAISKLDQDVVQWILNKNKNLDLVDFSSYSLAFEIFYDQFGQYDKKNIEKIKEILKLIIPKVSSSRLNARLLINPDDKDKTHTALWVAINKQDEDVIRLLLNQESIYVDYESLCLAFKIFYNQFGQYDKKNIEKIKEILKLIIPKASSAELSRNISKEMHNSLWIAIEKQDKELACLIASKTQDRTELTQSQINQLNEWMKNQPTEPIEKESQKQNDPLTLVTNLLQGLKQKLTELLKRLLH